MHTSVQQEEIVRWGQTVSFESYPKMLQFQTEYERAW